MHLGEHIRRLTDSITTWRGEAIYKSGFISDAYKIPSADTNIGEHARKITDPITTVGGYLIHKKKKTPRTLQ